MKSKVVPINKPYRHQTVDFKLQHLHCLNWDQDKTKCASCVASWLKNLTLTQTFPLPAADLTRLNYDRQSDLDPIR